ncbi:hypothetical protein ACOMHN_052996 [Nucella lapillus]
MTRTRGSKTTSKYYAVRRGRTVGIFATWNAASRSVTGYPKAAHKSYDTLEAARLAMCQAGVHIPSVYMTSDDEDTNEQHQQHLNEETCAAESQVETDDTEQKTS